MHMGLTALQFVAVMLLISPLFTKIISLALGQSDGGLSENETILKNMEICHVNHW